MEQVKYSIKDLEHFTQIKAHTIRIWEQRYGLLTPKRTETNIRYYSDDDLKKILNINLLYTQGWKISKIAKLSSDEIQKKAEEIIRSDNDKGTGDLDLIIVQILDLNRAGLIKNMELQYSESGMIGLYQDLVRPTLIRIGELWQVNTVQIVHEHFFSSVLKEFVITKQSTLHDLKKSKKAVLFLHQNEEHELSLLFQRYILERNDFEVIYLGAKLPIDQLPFVFEQHSPDVVVTNFISRIGEKYFKQHLEFICDTTSAPIIISGNQIEKYSNSIDKAVIICDSIASFNDIIQKL